MVKSQKLTCTQTPKDGIRNQMKIKCIVEVSPVLTENDGNQPIEFRNNCNITQEWVFERKLNGCRNQKKNKVSGNTKLGKCICCFLNDNDKYREYASYKEINVFMALQ